MGRGQSAGQATGQIQQRLLFGQRRGQGPSSGLQQKSAWEHELRMIEQLATSHDWAAIAERLALLDPQLIADDHWGRRVAETALAGLPEQFAPEHGHQLSPRQYQIAAAFPDEAALDHDLAGDELRQALRDGVDLRAIDFGIPLALLGREQPGPLAYRLAERLTHWPQGPYFKGAFGASGMEADRSLSALSLSTERGPAWQAALRMLAEQEVTMELDGFRPLDQHYCEVIDGLDLGIRIHNRGKIWHLVADDATSVCGRSIAGWGWRPGRRGTWQAIAAGAEGRLCAQCQRLGHDHSSLQLSSDGQRFSDQELAPLAPAIEAGLRDLLVGGETAAPSWGEFDQLAQEQLTEQLASIATDRVMQLDPDDAWRRLLGGRRYKEFNADGPLPEFDREALAATMTHISYLRSSIDRERLPSAQARVGDLVQQLRGIEPEPIGPMPTIAEWRRWRRAIRSSTNKPTAEAHVFIAGWGNAKVFTTIAACGDHELQYEPTRHLSKRATHRCPECLAAEAAGLSD